MVDDSWVYTKPKAEMLRSAGHLLKLALDATGVVD